MQLDMQMQHLSVPFLFSLATCPGHCTGRHHVLVYRIPLGGHCSLKASYYVFSLLLETTKQPTTLWLSLQTNARAWISAAKLLSTDLLGQKAPRFDGQ